MKHLTQSGKLCAMLAREVSGLRRFAMVAVAIAALIATSASSRAQDVTVPMPGEYSGLPPQPSPMDQLTDQTAILDQDGSTFAIPIPGGGEIQVEGPSSETPTHLSPIENWAALRNQPFSIGATPIGPAPTQK